MVAGPWPNGWSAKVAPVETDETRAQRLAAAIGARPQAEMRSYDPTWRDRARGLAASILGDRTAEGFFGKGLIGDDTGLVDMTPAGFPLALDDIHRSGNMTNLGINTVAALPIPGARMLKDAVEPVVKKGIRAFHGSPHDFDKFDMSKIGTGEGAQAYGHGLYFAENEGVAKAYRDQLGGQPKINDQNIWDNLPWMRSMERRLATDALKEAQAAGLSGDDAVAAAAKFLNDKGHGIEDGFKRQPYYDAANNLRPLLGKNWDNPPGRMYEASISASPDEFLDWDKPLSEQPAMMAKLGWTPEKVAEYRRLTKVHDDDLLAQLTNNSAVSTSAEAREAYEKARALVREIGFSPDQKGEAIARGGSVFDSAADAGKAEKLRAAGIKGIRYKDAGSRVEPQELKVWRDAVATYKASGDPKLAAAEKRLAQLENEHGRTHNYVVFDSDIIEILRKYGIAGLVGGGAASAAIGSSGQAEAADRDRLINSLSRSTPQVAARQQQ